MRQRGISTPVAVILACLAGLAVAGLLMDWLIVDVRPKGSSETPRVWVPIPLSCTRVAVAAVPDSAFPSEKLPAEVRENRDLLVAVLSILEETPDADLVSVSSPDGDVLVRVEKGWLMVNVDAEDTRVRLRLPLDRAADAARHWDGERIDGDLIRASLDLLDDGFEISVDDPDVRVRVAVE